jgi:hypothetical protein
MKYLFLIFSIISCSPYYKPKTDYKLPPELDDCKIFEISDGSKALYVVRCSRDDVAVSWDRSCGKNCTTREYASMTNR